MPQFLVQIVIRAIYVFLLSVSGKLGMDATQHTHDAMEAAIAIGTGAAGLALFIWQSFRHRFGAATPVEDPRNGVSAVPGVPLKTPDGSNVTPLAILALLAGCSLAGCSLFAQPTTLTPKDKALADVVKAQTAFIVLTKPVNEAIKSGDIRGEAAASIIKFEDDVVAYIDAARIAAKEDRLVDADTQLRLFDKAYGDLVDLIFRLTRKSRISTQPAGILLQEYFYEVNDGRIGDRGGSTRITQALKVAA